MFLFCSLLQRVSFSTETCFPTLGFYLPWKWPTSCSMFPGVFLLIIIWLLYYYYVSLCHRTWNSSIKETCKLWYLFCNDALVISVSDKYVLGGELQTIKNRTRSCFPAAAAFLVQTIFQVFFLFFFFITLLFFTMGLPKILVEYCCSYSCLGFTTETVSDNVSSLKIVILPPVIS